jgi:phage tail sheath gpL-like
MKTEYKQLGNPGTRYRPVRIAVFGQADASYSDSMAKRQVFTADEVGSLYGYTSPLYLMVRSLLPSNGDGVGSIPVWVYPISVTGTPLQSVGDITPTGTATKTQTYYAKINNVLSNPIVIVSGDSVSEFITKAIAAINGKLGMPGAASDGTTKLDFTVGWDGDTGDNVYLEMVSPDDAELSFAYTQPTGGGGTISVEAAGEGLNLIGEAWDTHIVNALDYDDTTNLDSFSAFGEGRWAPEVRKPLLVFTGTNEATLATVTAVTDARKTDRTNCIIANPGSNDLPFVIAADHVRRSAKRANENPPYDYAGLACPELTPGLDSVQWGSNQRDTAVKAGCSTVEIVDGEVQISDTVTCYHPTGEDPPAYAYAVDQQKIATMIYNFELEFNSTKWKGVPLLPNGQATDNDAAKKPKDAVSAMARIYANAGLAAIISDVDFAIANSTATISSTNPKRLDIIATFKLSGNVNVLPITLQFGFYYGGQS